MNAITVIKVLCGILVAAIIISYGWWGAELGLPFAMPDSAVVRQWFDGLGAWGPAAIIGSMVVAILVSPIPSAPIALAAGAIYGHYWGRCMSSPDRKSALSRLSASAASSAMTFCTGGLGNS